MTPPVSGKAREGLPVPLSRKTRGPQIFPFDILEQGQSVLDSVRVLVVKMASTGSYSRPGGDNNAVEGLFVVAD